MKKTLAMILTAVFCVSLSGCVNKTTDEPAETSVEIISETSVATTEATTEVAFVTEETDVTEEYAKLVEVSPNNRFIDFDFIEDYQGGEVSEEIKKAAVICLMNSDYYKESDANKEKLRKEKDKEIYSEYKQLYDFERFYDNSGNIVPIVSAAYPGDYDVNGEEEAFVLVDIPYYIYEEACIRSFVVYVPNSTFETEIVGDFTNIDQTILLDYGVCKQLIIGGYGTMGADDHDIIYGVADGKAKELYGFRGGFVKTECFLGSYGWQGDGCTMYYDTEAKEYRSICGEKLNWRDVLAMDSTGVLKKYSERCTTEGIGVFIQIIGKKYYCVNYGPSDIGIVYTYENGEFKLFDSECETAIRHSYGGDVIDIDMGKALEEMITPEEAKQAANNKNMAE